MPALYVMLASLLLHAAPTNGEELVRAMHDKYAGKWYTTMSFEQKTIQANGSFETWYEFMRVPGILRIDITPLDSGRAIVFRNDTLYNINGGAIRSSRAFVHPLMVLGFDVYGDSIAKTIRRLKALNIDLAKFSTNTWQGRPVYVVGAVKGDTTSTQFWVDQERLLFVRMLQTGANGAWSETQFNKYVPAGSGWVSAEVVFNTNGQLRTREEYSDIRTGEKFDDAFFDPAKFVKINKRPGNR